MGYMPRDRREQDALDLYRIKSLAGRFLLEVSEITGTDCRLHPELRFSIGDLRSALADLEGDADGLLNQCDPDRLLESRASHAPLSSREVEWTPHAIAAE